MNYLIDTYYVLWTLFDPSQLSENIVDIFESEEARKYVSPITFWEISLKYSIGKLELDDTDPKEIYDVALASGFELLPIDHMLFVSYFQLPVKKKHRDPFDRMLIWQAINDDLVFVTRDKDIREYKVDGLKIEQGT